MSSSLLTLPSFPSDQLYDIAETPAVEESGVLMHYMDQDARYASFYQDQQFKITVQEYQRQARDAVSQAAQESSESYEVLIENAKSRRL